MTEDIWLFSYGTLRQENVQRVLFGRLVECVDDVLTGFKLHSVLITDASVIEKSGSDRHPILRRADDSCQIPGSALSLTPADLQAADHYEAADYERVPVVLKSGRKAFVYVQRDEA